MFVNSSPRIPFFIQPINYHLIHKQIHSCVMSLHKMNIIQLSILNQAKQSIKMSWSQQKTPLKNGWLCIAVLALSLSFSAHAIEITLYDTKTCMQFDVEQPHTRLFFSYHYNSNMEKVNMILYDHNQNILDQSGIGLEYSHFLGALYNESGHYEMCFLKNTTEQTEIHFEVEKHEEGEAEMHAGKEEINKLSRRISSFLVDIKKLSWEYKEVLTQHNQRHNKLAANEESNYWLYLIKFTAMLLIMVIQIMIVRKIYQ